MPSKPGNGGTDGTFDTISASTAIFSDLVRSAKLAGLYCKPFSTGPDFERPETWRKRR
jgi:hypothetical protein